MQIFEIIPDVVYRDDKDNAVRVVRVTGGVVYFTGAGGGFERSTSAPEFRRVFKPESPNRSRMELCYVTADFMGEKPADAAVEAFCDPSDRWNGFMKPYFPRRSLEIVCAKLSLTITDSGVTVPDQNEPGESDTWGWREIKPSVVLPSMHADADYAAGAKCCDLGAGYWIWDLAYPPTTNVAREFCKRIANYLGPKNLAKCIARNAARTDAKICHSHDFCDANVLMAEALNAAAGYEIDCDDLMENDTLRHIWNTAWDLAKAARFNPGLVA